MLEEYKIRLANKLHTFLAEMYSNNIPEDLLDKLRDLNSDLGEVEDDLDYSIDEGEFEASEEEAVDENTTPMMSDYEKTKRELGF